jgi:lipid-A-disaccharide synthase
MRIGIVANEPSGDLLGAGLIRSLLELRPEARFEGVGGPRMVEAGCRSLYPMETLSVMGLFEVVRHLPAILAIRRGLLRRFQAEPPDLFIGIDAPDFNLGLEARLKARGVPSVHYVCPSVWAWRPARVEKIRRAVDLLLSILPFEAPFLARHRVPARYIGHPLADELGPADSAAARAALGLAPDGPLVALLPGSRGGEVGRLARPFLETAQWCHQRRPELRFAVPLVNAAVSRLFAAERARFPAELPVTAVDGQGRELISAADLVLTASGTATLEAMLLQRPMVVGYRLSAATYGLVKALDLVKVPYVSLPNLLADEALVPEFIQQRCRVELLGPALLDLLADGARRRAMQARFAELGRTLRRDASREAARAVLELIEG